MKKVKRKWGYYRTLLTAPKIKVKLLCFEGWQGLSIQRHFYRNELWFALWTNGYIILNGKCRDMWLPFQWLTVRRGNWHQFINYGKKSYFIEVQYGELIDEEDIERVLTWKETERYL